MIDTYAYKQYHSPLCLLLGYVIGNTVCIAGLTIALTNLLIADFSLGFFNGIIRTIIFGLIYLAAIFVYGLCIVICGYRSSKIYRGIGFYRFINIVTILCPISIITVSAIIKFGNMTAEFDSFFEIIAVVGIWFFPFIIRFAYYHKFIRKCPSCGLINTMTQESQTDTEVGKRMEFYDLKDFEAGDSSGLFRTKPKARIYTKTEHLITMRCTVCDNVNYDCYTTES